MQRIAELSECVADLRRRVELAEAVRGNGNGNGYDNSRGNQQTEAVICEADDSSSAIEVLTENGFSIVRPWELDGSPAPADGQCRFRVCDPHGKERDVQVEISGRLITETSLHTCGRIERSNSFWICCAERQLVNYLWEHDAFPDGDSLLIENLDPEEVILATRWERSG